MNSDYNSPKPIAPWRFWIPLLFQVVLILAVPAQAVYTYLSGTTVVLQTVPVDPYDLLRGYYQTLRYNISSEDDLKDLPGWETLTKQTNQGNRLQQGTRFYLILEEPGSSEVKAEMPQPWKAVAVSRDRPVNLPTNQVALEGEYKYSWIDYGLEKYYMPEDQREEINAHINQTVQNSGQERPFVVEVKVDSSGKAVPVSLFVGDRKYRF